MRFLIVHAPFVSTFQAVPRSNAPGSAAWRVLSGG